MQMEIGVSKSRYAPRPRLVPARARVDVVPARAEIRPHYMPLVELAADNVLGYEALLRVSNPSVSPLELFDCAEKQGSIAELDLNALYASVRDGSQLGGRLFINLDPRTLLHPARLLETLLELAGDGAELDRLTLEITERANFVADARTLGLLQRLQNLGIEIALDDIDDGQSHLAHLRAIAPRYLKLSSAIGRKLLSSADSEKTVANAVKLARDNGSALIIEGLETAAQVEAARALGATYGQGYFWGKPIAATDLAALTLAA